ncbi:MAG: hypothetical protein KJ709_04185 [Nanoarchaeota archaeon]|nr:hypothetical protein [Nanoarchaeota archaeon]
MDYKTLEKKHGLPAGLKQSFDLPDDCKSLHEARKKAAEHLDTYIQYLEGLLQSETSFANVYECKLFNDDDKKRVFSAYKHLMLLSRTALELGLDNDPAKDLSYLKHALEAWQGVKEELKEIFNKVKAAWQEESEPGDSPGYFG